MSRKPVPIVFTATEQKIVDVLADGRKHSIEEIQSAIDGEFTSIQTIRVHLVYIRKKLPEGEDIISTRLMNRKPAYIWVRLLPSACNGKR